MFKNLISIPSKKNPKKIKKNQKHNPYKPSNTINLKNIHILSSFSFIYLFFINFPFSLFFQVSFTTLRQTTGGTHTNFFCLIFKPFLDFFLETFMLTFKLVLAFIFPFSLFLFIYIFLNSVLGLKYISALLQKTLSLSLPFTYSMHYFFKLPILVN
ncbi:unnamed protein product [Meloidogyne enterolobii]|uniref:Uncharacterized protein n=2 Tax=Meloidogyne enterolobii TaxID=390850 RepID=A0A6V7VSZ6_MELEN|nr:unnamed protein product [Meloidogyne enterolobii]